MCAVDDLVGGVVVAHIVCLLSIFFNRFKFFKLG